MYRKRYKRKGMELLCPLQVPLSKNLYVFSDLKAQPNPVLLGFRKIHCIGMVD